MRRWTPSLQSLLIFCVLGGCTPETRSLQTKGELPTVPLEALDPVGGLERTNEEVLARLWEQRIREGSPSDLPLGVGDVLEISVSPGEILKDFAVRVSGD